MKTIYLKISEKLYEYFWQDKWGRSLFFLLIFGAFIRYWGILNAENTDEYNEIFEALRLASGKVNLNRWIKKGYQTILAIEFGFYYVLGWISGLFKNPMDFASSIVLNMKPLLVIGRLTTASMAVGSFFVTYLIGNKLVNKYVGFTAAFLLVFNPIHNWSSHLATTDVPLTFFFLLTVYFLIKARDLQNFKYFYIASLFWAVALNIKMLAASGVIFFIYFYYTLLKDSDVPLWKYILNKKVLYSFLFFVLGWIIINPATVIGFKEFINSFIYRAELYDNVMEQVPYSTNAYLTYLDIMVNHQFYPILFLFAFLGILYSFFKNKNRDYTIVSIFLILHYLLISNTEYLVQDRYMMIMFPFTFILCGVIIEKLYLYLTKFKYGYILFTIVIISAIAIPVKKVVTHTISLTGSNTLDNSKEWIEKNIPDGSKVIIDAGRTLITQSPQIHHSKQQIEEMYNKVSNLKQGETFDSPNVKIVDSYSSIYFKLILEHEYSPRYWLYKTQLGTKLDSYDNFLQENFEYAITSGNIQWNLNRPLWRKKYPKSVEFYNTLKDRGELIKEFEPSWNRGGPVIKIYKLK